MPELPEVETVARFLRRAIVGTHVKRAEGLGPRYAGVGAFAPTRIESVRRRGKWLLLDGTRDRSCAVHLGMTGVLSVGDAVPGRAHLRARCWLADGRVLDLIDPRGFGRVVVVPTRGPTGVRALDRLGADPTDPDLDRERAALALAGRDAPVKAVLLDQQGPLCGVGNIYADEACHRAGIRPDARRLDAARARQLVDAVVVILDEGIRNGGTTVRDYRRPDGTGGGHQHHLAVYGRAGQPCRRCGAALARARVAGRGTTWCVHCQR